MKELFGVMLCFTLLSPLHCEASERCLEQSDTTSTPKEEALVRKTAEKESVPEPKWYDKRNDVITILSGNADPDFPKLALNNAFLQLLQKYKVTKVIELISTGEKDLCEYFQEDKPDAIHGIWHIARERLQITDTVFLAALILCARCGNATWLAESNLGTWITVGIMLAQKFVEDTALKAKVFADVFLAPATILAQSEMSFLKASKYNCYIDPKEVKHLEDLLWAYKKNDNDQASEH